MELDALLGGGLDRGTSTMLMGPPGTGKSTLAIKFALAAAERGEKVAALHLRRNDRHAAEPCGQTGHAPGKSCGEGLIALEQIDPAEISPGELAHRIRHAVAKEDMRMIVIDSINGYLNAMPAESYLTLQLHELLAYLNQQGVITVMVLAQQGLVGAMQSTSI